MGCHHLHFVTFCDRHGHLRTVRSVRVSAAAAGDLQRCRELLQRKAAAPDAAYVSWIHNISALMLPPPNNPARV